ncbi:hypothetical protein FO519_002440 [Halicephalobus sp. NKZ332]|nr:hypothetical protein FO519_002440 [Halicephalobus sp. NKZ332]
MSLMFWDPFRFHRRHDPSVMDVLDTFFDENTNRLRLRDHAARLSVKPNGDFDYKVNASGFKPEELKVDLEGEELVVRGEHNDTKENESVQRSFVRRVKLPHGSCKDTIKCDMDSEGHLIVTGIRASLPESQKKSIPITFKEAQPAIEHKKTS